MAVTASSANRSIEEVGQQPQLLVEVFVAAVPKDNQKVFWEMFENQERGWVVNFFKQKQIAVAPAAVDHLLDMVENNSRDMRVECDRLALFFGPDSTTDLERVCARNLARLKRLRSVKADLHPRLLRLAVYYIVQRAGQGAWRQ